MFQTTYSVTVAILAQEDFYRGSEVQDSMPECCQTGCHAHAGLGPFCGPGGRSCASGAAAQYLPLCSNCGKCPVKFGKFVNKKGKPEHHKFCTSCVEHFAPHKLPICQNCRGEPVKKGTYRAKDGSVHIHKFCASCVERFAPHKLPICRNCRENPVKSGTYKAKDGSYQNHEFCTSCISARVPLCNACRKNPRVNGKLNGKWYTKCIQCIGWCPRGSETS